MSASLAMEGGCVESQVKRLKLWHMLVEGVFLALSMACGEAE